jgi:hypothetical protein
MWFLFGEEGGFHKFLIIGQPNGLLKKNQNKIKTFVFWDAAQLIYSINMNHNKYLSSCKILGQKWWWTKFQINVIFKQWGGQNVHSKIFLEIC